MSHLTAPMPHQGPQAPKPYLYDLPRPAHPLTPPDTDYETPSNQVPPAPNMTGLEMDPLPHMPSGLDSPYASPYGSLHRKKPSVTYVHSGLREARERVVQRGLRWLVVVVPPASFAREHGHLGHTLSSGPSRRLSNGLLMPLYPSLSSQLGAIAREFSFPSISGLCVYLHTSHGGISLTPRVSDDSWPMLWSHLFDARSPSLPIQQLPISGQIEFDIDLTKARWYDSWIASSRRDFVDVPQSVTPSRAQSISHWRHDSQTSNNEPLDDQTDAVSVAQQTTAKGRNIKKLSLLDRFDTMSVRSGSKLVPRDESPPSQSGRQLTAQALSPIVQEDEPLTAKKAIDSRVQSWRMSATAAARSPLAFTGQTSLDPVNMPNTMTDLPTASASEFELNLDDYTWSVSSVGPPDYDVESLDSWERTHSVHLDRRGEGSVCLTPSICTSFGPDDDFVPFSPVSYISRLPSPDLAWRMLEDVPPTPTTATSWGAPLEWPPSPVASSYTPSIDIAHRFLSSAPVTPTTATSWGAPSSYPPSPAMISRVPSPDLGHRVATSVPSSPRTRSAADPHYALSVPYLDASVYRFAVPYFDASREQVAGHRQAERMTRFVFPPPKKARRVVEDEKPTASPGYPTLDIYPSVYPTFDIYPALLTLDHRKLGTPAVSPGAAYPAFDLYPAVYPSFNIYPAVVSLVTSEVKELPARLSASYPNIVIYPAVYPHLTIYPMVSQNTVVSNAVDKRSASVVPVLLPLSSGYPDFNIYPSVGYPWSVYEIYPKVDAPPTAAVASLPGIPIRLQATYPALEIYSPVYPYSLERIYPSVVAKDVPLVRSFDVSVGVALQYPVFTIYPAVLVRNVPKTTLDATSTFGEKVYPAFNIYPAVYPWSVYEIYPAVHRSNDFKENTGVLKLAAQYPAFDIYPSVYPYSLEVIYPTVALERIVSGRSGIPVELAAVYPNVCPYPPVYPHFAIYPVTSSAEGSVIEVSLRDTQLMNSQYPYLVIYPAVYPFMEIYPGSWGPPARASALLPSQNQAVRRRKPTYTHMELRAQVAAQLASTSVPQPRKPRYTHMELRAQVLAAAARSFPRTPAILPARTVPAPVPAFPPTRVLPPAPGPPSARAISPRVVSPVPSTSMSVSPSGPRVVSPAERFISPSPAAYPTPTATPAPAALSSPESVPSRPRPPQMELREDNHAQEHIDIPAIVAVEPSPVASDIDPGSPVLFEMVTVPTSAPVKAPTPSPSEPAAPAAPILVRSRSRSGTVSARPAPPSGAPRPLGARPVSVVQPPSSELPSVPSAQRSLNRLSGLPAHPAVNRRVSSSVGPRPMSTLGPLPPPPQAPPAGPIPPPPLARRQSMMSPLREEPSLVKTRSPQLPSPPEEWQMGFRTPTETISPVSSLASGNSDLSRSKTMPTRAAPRGPRSSTLISERAKAFDNPNVVPSPNGALKLSMATLAEFPAPPPPPLPSSASPSRTPTSVSKLDRSKYPFA
ncbi:hypothetical protein DICSQDRAFT_86763 [Dichomitus squalens LYAD-421 SS1]|uniref:Uncharacterized protein n=1 Tax=Dichomitus squalens (strain LYAD-421) TaxID=732165 RepID=R7SZV2_DICSQ|nr:uncharacterized protein DICSQDRAFT_86763 [Dichomitus squalens LYAD-421 SS1]EJF61240.1 hypothetical protein DICSQDRAFT_86763 [Dichomitus squalens LYAD-421 SS1]